MWFSMSVDTDGSAVAVGCTLSVTSIQLFSFDWDSYKGSLYFCFSEGSRVCKSVTGRWQWETEQMLRAVRQDISHKCSLWVSEGSLAVKNPVERKEWVARCMLLRVSTAELIHHMTSFVPEFTLWVKMRPHSERLHTSSCSLLPMHVLTTVVLLTWNSLVHSDSRRILCDPRPAARFQGTEETSVHPGPGYIGTDHRLWPKCNYAFLEPQSVSTVHITSWCTSIFTYRQCMCMSRTKTAFVLVQYFSTSAVTYSFKYNPLGATLYNILYCCQYCTCFRRFLHPSSGAKNCTHSMKLSSLLAATLA
jgi:hypothetical protein